MYDGGRSLIDRLLGGRRSRSYRSIRDGHAGEGFDLGCRLPSEFIGD
jgi:hypothetical protein